MPPFESNIDRTVDIVVARDIFKTFESFEALKGVNLTVKKGEVVVIIGPSGSGKSTFIRTLNRLEGFDRGEIVIDGIRLEDGANLDTIRREVGMVFQNFNLFPHLTVLQNITLAPVKVRKLEPDAAERLALDLLKRVGIVEQANKYPGSLSGGQQQRVAIARSLINDPYIILADEATGNLDTKTSHEIMTMLGNLNDAGKTIIMVTHEDDIAEHAKRIIRMRDGLIVEDGPSQRMYAAAAGLGARGPLANAQ